jgi:methylphosphotriester-DNA--protein-cysteine methyltransferase
MQTPHQFNRHALVKTAYHCMLNEVFTKPTYVSLYSFILVSPTLLCAVFLLIVIIAITFRQDFRAITGTSSLQYQRQLRLQQARQLMLTQNMDAGSASGQVGYESAS